MKIKDKFILGTAQFSENYGLFGKKKLKKKDIFNILNLLKQKKINRLDNSSDYKGSEIKIKNFKEKKWKISTKIKFHQKDLVINNKDHLKKIILKKINLSKKKLGIRKFEILLINNYEIFKPSLKKNIYEVLTNLKKRKFFDKFGYSIYNFKKLEKTISNFCPDVIQCPYNVFDLRLNNKKLQKIIKKNNIKIHARSVFLQGLLLCNLKYIPKKFEKWESLFLKWEHWINKSNISKLDACISHVLSNNCIDKIIVGVKDIEELKQILRLRKLKKIKPPKFYSKSKDILINPSKW